MKSLQEIQHKINPKKQFFIFLAIIFIANTIGSFAIGRISVLESQKQESRVKGVFIDTSASEVYFDAQEARSEAQMTIFASINGTRYYPANCRAGKSIKEENRIWFINENEAKMAGYTLAKSCVK